MKQLITAIAAVAAGATAMYFLDPDTGHRRRAVVRDKTVSVATGRSRLPFGRSANVDRKLHERIRACLERVVSYPEAVAVDVRGGEVRLLGDILKEELDALLAEIRSVHGVTHVIDQLDAHEDANGVPALQSNGDRSVRNGGARRFSAIVPIVAIAAPIALMVAASTRPLAQSRRMSWQSANPLHQFAPWRRNPGIGSRARRYVQQLLPH